MRSTTTLAIGAFIAFLALNARYAASDDIVLKSGEVIEGDVKEIDQKAGVIRLQVDEAGKIRIIKIKDIEKIFEKKTSWQRRAQYEKDYEKQLKMAKETWESQFALGKWCKTHMLPEKAPDHYGKAGKLRIEQVEGWLKDGKLKPESELEHRLKVAKWLDFDCSLPDEAKKQFEICYKLKKEKLGADENPDTHYALGIWLKDTAKLEERALGEFEKAVELNPKHTKAIAAVKTIKESFEFQAREMIAEYGRTSRAWKLTVAIEDNSDMKFLEEWRDRMQLVSDYFFNLTEGQFFIQECEIEDATSEGRILIEKGKLDWFGLNNKQGSGVLAYCTAGGMPMWNVHAPGKCGISVLAHEMGHGAFGLPDEYYQNPQCDCMMRAAPNPQKLCTKETHIGGGRTVGPPGSEGKDCWTIVLNRKEWKGAVVQPNPGWTWAGDTTKTFPAKTGNHTDGLRNCGGELKYKNLKMTSPPKTVFKLIDN
jgi:tetratricopeptide (TPR) repeat protein